MLDSGHRRNLHSTFSSVSCLAHDFREGISAALVIAKIDEEEEEDIY